MSPEVKTATALGFAASVVVSGVASAESGENERNDQDVVVPLVTEVADGSPAENVIQISDEFEVIYPDENTKTTAIVEGEDLKEKPVLKEKKKKESYNKYTFRKKGYIRQPDLRTCAAASSFGMLNSIEMRDVGGPDFRWKFNKSVRDVLEARLYMRRHDTLDAGGVGTDPNGWVKFLNKAWGGKEVYEIRAYEKKNRALTDLVKSIYVTGMPAGLFADGGSHAKYVTGFDSKVDPTSDKFKASDIEYLHVSDPLGAKNKRMSLKEFMRSRDFSRYDQTDSHRNGRSEYMKWHGDYTFIMANPQVVNEMKRQEEVK